MRSYRNLYLTILLSGLACACATGPRKAEIKPMSAEQMSHKTARIAAVQITGNWNWNRMPDPDNDPADLAVPYIEKAAKDGADLVCFPELFLGMFRIPSPQTEKIAEAARKHQINVIIGCFEVTDQEGNYKNSTLIFDREGEIIGRYFKAFQAVGRPPYLWPPDARDPEWMMVPGDEFPVFDLDFGRIGILTCYDGSFPEIFRILALKGAEIIIWPNARNGEIEWHIVRSTMEQSHVHMVTINKAIGGGTMICQWPFHQLAKSEEGKEDYVIADLDMAQLRDSRINARIFHQRRGEIFKELTLDYDVWEQYGEHHPIGLDAPKPSHEHHMDVLKNSGIDLPE